MISGVSPCPSSGKTEEYDGEFTSEQSEVVPKNLERSQKFTNPKFFAKSRSLEYLFLFTAMLSQLLALSATTTVLPILKMLQHDFDVSEATATWYIASIGLGLGTLILFSGSLGDRYGPKIVILAGYAWTLIWSLLSGLSYYVDSNFFVCCRTFQGCGLAFVLPNILGVIGRIYKPNTLAKNVAFCLVGYAAPLGAFFGTLFMGIIGFETKRWDWGFYAFTIVCFVALILSWITIPVIEPNKKQSIDWIGSILGVSGLVLFNFAWNQAPEASWSSPYIIVLLIVGILLIAVFVLYEIKFAKSPLLEPTVFKNLNLMLTLTIVFIGWGSYGIKLYQYFQMIVVLRDYTTVASGATNTPIVVGGGIACFLCAFLLKKKEFGRHVLLFSMVSFLASDLILATCPVNETYWRSTFGFWWIAVFGMNWSFPGATVILSDSLPPHLQGLSGSLVSTAVNYGISIFLGISGTVNYQLSQQMEHSDPELRAWRGTMYFSIGVSSLASVIGLVLWVLLYRTSKSPT